MERFLVLDGLRGLAILLVFLNHIPSNFIAGNLPALIKPLVEVFFSSGTIAVWILFCLSGFLMAYLYEKPENPWFFLAKRYGRIFPLFITANLIRFFLKQFNHPNLLIYSAALFGIPILVFLIYRLIAGFRSTKLNLFIFFGFVALQAVTAFYYLFFVLRSPALSFAKEPYWQREITILLVNSTLVLPLGNYVPFLDGVYWSLTTEVLFYWLYPFLFVPFIAKLKNASRLFQMGFFIALIFLLFGFSKLFQNTLSLSMLQIHLFAYFAAGITLAITYKNLKSKPIKSNNWLIKLSLLSLLFWLLGVNIFNKHLAEVYQPLFKIIASAPLAFILFLGLDKNSSLSKFLNQRFWLYLGMVSYSFYLVHTNTVNLSKRLIAVNNWQSNLLLLMVALPVTVLAAIYLYYLIEKKRIADKPETSLKFTPNFKTAVCLLLVFYFLCSLLVYQSNFNFFASEVSYFSQKKQVVIDQKNSWQFMFKSRQNNLGIVVFNLSALGSSGNSLTQVVFSIKRQGEKQWLYQTKTSLGRLNQNSSFPFGFPVIQEAKNQTFTAQLQLTNAKSKEKLVVNLQPVAYTVVHQPKKTDFIRQPRLFVDLLMVKISRLTNNQEAKLVWLCAFPFLCWLGMMAASDLTKKKNSLQ